MRRNRGGSTSLSATPVKVNNHNNNSNSCSNDAVFANINTPTTRLTVNTTTTTAISNHQNAILVNENKIRSLLKDLQVYVKKYDEERKKSEPNLTTINKTHEKMKKEDKLTSFNRKKLRNMYAVSLKDADNEIRCLRQALDCINEVRTTQNQIRILQQQQRSPSSTTVSPKMATNFGNIKLNHHSPNSTNHHDITLNHDETEMKLLKKTATMRRGVLMSILQQAALTLPLWVGEIGQAPPPLCGSLPPESSYICKPGDKVAAIVKNNNAPGDDSEEENWILAEVVQYHPNTSKYDVDDVDAEEGQERFTLGKKKVVPLPLWRANPLTDPDAIFQKDSFVLALYPQTTCFYRGIVSESPQTPSDDYLILFEDNTYPEGYSPPLNVPQLYVVADRG